MTKTPNLLTANERMMFRDIKFTVGRTVRQRQAHIYRDADFPRLSLCGKSDLGIGKRLCTFFMSDRVCDKCLVVFREMRLPETKTE